MTFGRILGFFYRRIFRKHVCRLTYDCEIDPTVPRLRHFEIDATSVDGLIGFPNVVHPKLSGLFLSHEVRPVSKHILIGPPLSETEIAFPPVHTANKTK